MIKIWGVLSESSPPTEGEEGDFCLNCEKSRSSGRSFRAFFFKRIKQAKPRSLPAVGPLLDIQG